MDIIFSINTKETEKHNKLVLETFLGKNKITKKGFYSGLLKKVDLNQVNQVENICSKEFDILKKILLDINNPRISKNQICVSSENILKIFKRENLEGNVYWLSKEKKHLVIKKIIFSKQDFTEKNEKEILLFSKNSLSYKDGLLYVDIYQDENINQQTNDNISENVQVDPMPLLYLEKKDKEIIGNLFYSYNGIHIPSDSKETKVIKDKKYYMRDLNRELYFEKIIITGNFRKSKSNQYKYVNSGGLIESINFLLENGFNVYYFNGKKIIPKNDTFYNISYDINWFSIDANVKIEDEIINLSQYLKISNNNNFVEIDDKLVILPKSISKYRTEMVEDQGKLIVSKSSLLPILDIASDIQVDIKNFESFVDYAGIEVDLPDKLKNALRHYQLAGVKWLKWLYKNNLGGCLADDMGLGKTIQIIALFSDQEVKKKGRNNLIIAPKTLLTNWQREIKKFNDNLNTFIFHGSRRNADELYKLNDSIIITTYATAANEIKTLLSMNLGLIVFDEIQIIKNSISKTYKKLSGLKSLSKIGLSGTPLENNLMELWSVLNILNSNTLSSKQSLFKRYLPKNGSEYQESNQIKSIISPFVLRRTKGEVLHELPIKTEEIIYCDMLQSQRNLYEAMLVSINRDMERKNSRYEIIDSSYILKGLLMLRQICCHPSLLTEIHNVNSCKESGKFETLKFKVAELYERGRKIIIFSQFTSMLNIIKKWCESKGFNHFYLDGQLNNRQKVVDDFQNADRGIFLISLKAGGVGLNLISAYDVIIYDPWWNPAAEKQAADRVHRIGQTHPVTIYKLITANSIEEKVLKLQDIKNDLFNITIENIDTKKYLTIETLKSLIYDR
ncbi:DEAD/DEAH box helicase [Heliophilum fasciatum]|uniref:Helicase-like protein n=1 Tax=Heliophilum fasciatum TaxID=35700 RepID=A0A4R2R9T9_9FIRM|nr:DEAD/DEAH box helicase [Heliophilum fasciatum]MCW2279402.1 SNF2 family DNA or RNA helicase [Heliophilum fasciatum]TCP60002.1 helicase-like protein [Heliophilum fasciatum]